MYRHFFGYFDTEMKVHLEQIKTNSKFWGENSRFVDSGFVKTCDELDTSPKYFR